MGLAHISAFAHRKDTDQQSSKIWRKLPRHISPPESQPCAKHAVLIWKQKSEKAAMSFLAQPVCMVIVGKILY